MAKSKLKTILEKEGFEPLGGGGIDYNKKLNSKQYLHIEHSLKSAIEEGYKKIIFDISRIKETENFIFRVYGKK